MRLANLVSIATVGYETPSRYHWMFQFYLRAAGLALSWVGSGRLVFSHDYTDADVAEVSTRILAAARAMHDDGWWWHQPSLTHAGIKRQVLFEMLAARLQGPARRRLRPRAPRDGCSHSSPRSTCAGACR